jgi:hypothetical protein
MGLIQIPFHNETVTVLVDSRLVVSSSTKKIFINPTRFDVKSALPQELKVAEFQALSWHSEASATRIFSTNLIISFFNSGIIWLSPSKSIFSSIEQIQGCIRRLVVKKKQGTNLAVMMAFHPRLGEHSLLSCLDKDLVKTMMIKI